MLDANKRNDRMANPNVIFVNKTNFEDAYGAKRYVV